MLSNKLDKNCSLIRHKQTEIYLILQTRVAITFEYRRLITLNYID
jgi:hypothetical protein